tara:strand:- start:1667 stop:2203 length:537 start_codon:yes stop_codon:yes gene_type:complete
MKYLLFVIIVFMSACSKQQSILICGDHECINKIEAKQYFEENLTIEVQIISKEKKSSFDLVDLNLGEKKRDIKVFKNNNKKIVKKLSKEEIKIKKNELRKKEQKSKLKSNNNKKNIEIAKKNNNLKKEIKKKVKNSDNVDTPSFDICTKLEKCDIDSITNYLIKASKEKDFPNISLRE